MRRLIPLLALAALAVFFYRQAVFTNLIFARGDTLLYFYPYWDYRAQTLLSGQLPLWNPYLFMGAPFLANSQAGVFYPLNWPLIFFGAPVAVKISLVVHIIIAAWGAYTLAWRAFSLEPLPAFLAASVFAFGGYLSAQVEHVNQLQGLAWLPFAVLSTLCITQADSSIRNRILYCSLLALFIALQLTAGHTQTAFITLVACLLVATYQLLINLQHRPDINIRAKFTKPAKAGLMVLALLGIGVLLGFGLASAQLLPTFELSRQSLRSGGLPLNEAVSFSLNPLLLGRALLPGYSRLIFSEFVAYIGVVPLVLATLGVTGWRGNRAVQLAALLAGVGLFFALGGYNPVYLLLARFVPGFNLFRVPARWLALFALGASLLSGLGLQLIRNQQSAVSNRKLLLISLITPVLIGLTFISANITPAGELGPIGVPNLLDLVLWISPLILLVIVSRLSFFSSRLGFWILGFGVLELTFASLQLPLNHLTAPDAYTSIRPAMTQLLAAQSSISSEPPARFLSLSQLAFDPGDLAELHSEWDSQLPPDAVYDAIVATKYKEVLSPNLPLTWRVPSVDGYDGGILPLRAYAEFAAQFGDVPANTDGRLGQFIKTIPPNSLLSLTNTRWVITDKTGDTWLDNVFYDLGLTSTATAATPITLTRLPDFQATALGLVLGEPAGTGVAQIAFTNGESVTLPITYDATQIAIRLRWEQPATVRQIDILTTNSLTLRGASLIDERTDTFQGLTLGPYRLAHSGDVKIYENLNVLPRAFVISNLQSPITSYQPVTFTQYTAEQVDIETNSDVSGYLVLTDANYPGWVATLDGQPIEIETAYGLFRAIQLPAGAHTVEFRFEPSSLNWGVGISGVAGVVWLVIFVLSIPNIFPVNRPGERSLAASEF